MTFFPKHYTTVEIGNHISREAKELASQIIDKAKTELKESAQKLRNKGISPDDIELTVVHQSRKKVKVAFKEFESTLEGKYKDSSDRGVVSIMRLAIYDGQSRFFDNRLEDALSEVMNQTFGISTPADQTPPKDPPEDTSGGSSPT